MTRHTATERKVTIAITLRATGERNESDSYRHKWTTTARLGLLQATGANVSEVKARLEGQIEALLRSPGAMAALAAEENTRFELYRREAPVLGEEAALQRLRIRACGRDPDAPQVDRHENHYPEET